MATGADVEIRYSVRPAQGVAVEKLVQDYAYPVAAPAWQGTLQDVPNETLLDCSNLLSTWAAWGEEAGLDWSDLNITYATTYAVVLSAALAGAGLCMAHDTIAGRLIETGQLKRPFDHRYKMKEAYYLILAPHLSDIPGGPEFVTWLREEIALDQSNRDGGLF